MKKTLSAIPFALSLALVTMLASCKVEQSNVADTKERKEGSASKAHITDVSIKEGKLIIKGQDLEGVNKVTIKAQGVHELFEIKTKSSSEIVAQGLREIGLMAGKVFQLVLADAHGSSTFQIQTTLKDGSVTGEKLHNMGAMDGDTLVYNRINDIWEARPLTGLKLRGTWDASLNEPFLSDRGYETSPMKGDYYIVGESGSSEIDGVDQWIAGNWIVFNGNEWQRVANASSAASFNGRTGIVTPEEGDYELNLLGDVETTGAVVGHVLKFDGTKWAPAPDASSDNGESIGSEHIANESLTNEDISLSANIDPAKIAGLPSALSTLSTNITSNTAGIGANQAAISANATAIASKAPLPTSDCAGTDKLVWSAGAFSCATDYDTNTNAASLCAAGEYLDGDGSCKVADTGDNIKSDGSVAMAANLNMAGNTFSNLNGLTVPSGNVGVGTPTPAEKLDVLGSIRSVNGAVKLWNSGYNKSLILGVDTTMPYINFATDNYGSIRVAGTDLISLQNGKVGIGTNAPTASFHAVGQNFKFTGTGAASTSLTLTPQTGNTFTMSANTLNITPNNLNLDARSMRLNTTVGHEPIRLMTAGSTRLYVGTGNSGGYVGIGTTTPTERLEVAGCIKHNNGTIGSACSSDRRLKDDIEDLDFGDKALMKFMRLRPRTYVYKTNPDATYYGFIAQEVLEVDKEMVSTKDNGYYAVDYERGKWLHFKASQEMARKIANLEEENTELKSRLERLEAAVEALQKR